MLIPLPQRRILITISVSKVALNHLKGILLQKTASEEQKLWYFPYRALWSTGQCRGEGTAP